MYIKPKGEETMKKTLAIMLALIMVLALVPTVAFAAGNTIYVDAKNGNDDQDDVGTTREKAYKSLDKAMKAAGQEATIYLAEGTYYGNSDNPSQTGEGARKSLTFVGAGSDKTTWQIRAMENNPSGDGPCDYSFQGSDRITFEKMTVVGSVYPDGTIKANDYQGFVRINHLKLKDCTFNGRADYWGYETTEFENVTFYAPGTTDSGITGTNYSLWTKTGWEYTFDNCTFNSTGKVINVYTDYSAGKHDITVNFKDCTVNNEEGTSKKPVLNINDSNMGNYKYILNITGDNNVTGVDVDDITCSRLFGFGGKEASNSGRSDVTINGVKVWKKCEQEGTQKGERACAHNGVVFGEGSYNGDKTTQYTDGYKDNAFTVEPNGPGSFEVTCDYCGYTETSTGKLYNDIGLTRTVRQNKNSNPVPEDAANSNKYKVANSSDITVDYTATMDMENLRWQVAGKDVEEIQKKLVELEELEESKVQSPWELLKALAQQIDDRTEVILTFKFDDKIDLKAFKAKYEAAVNAGKPTDVLMLTSDMFEIADGGVQFNTAKGTMTITCKWKEEANTEDTKITLYGFGLPVTNDWNGSKQIKIENSGCVSGMVHINPRGGAAVAMVGPAPNVAANQESIPTPSLDTIQIPIVGGCAADKFTLYYGGGSSGDSSGGSSSGGGYYYPTTTPVPVIVIPPKTGDMTVWQSILHFLGIR